MLGNVIPLFILNVISVFFFLVSCSSWISSKSTRQISPDVQMEASHPVHTEIKGLPEKRTANNSGDQFWLERNDNSSVKDDKDQTNSTDNPQVEEEEESTTLNNEVDRIDKLETINNDQPLQNDEMDEQIFLPEFNCNLEIQVKEAEDRRMKIQYDDLPIGASGQCNLKLHGKNGILLAILPTDVRLNRNGNGIWQDVPNETLQVITRKNGFNFTLKKYQGNEKQYPVILTDSDEVLLVRDYNNTKGIITKSSFNLEVFNYYKMENQITTLQQNDVNHTYGISEKDVDKVFITTASP